MVTNDMGSTYVYLMYMRKERKKITKFVSSTFVVGPIIQNF